MHLVAYVSLSPPFLSSCLGGNDRSPDMFSWLSLERVACTHELTSKLFAAVANIPVC